MTAPGTVTALQDINAIRAPVVWVNGLTVAVPGTAIVPAVTPAPEVNAFKKAAPTLVVPGTVTALRVISVTQALAVWVNGLMAVVPGTATV